MFRKATIHLPTLALWDLKKNKTRGVPLGCNCLSTLQSCKHQRIFQNLWDDGCPLPYSESQEQQPYAWRSLINKLSLQSKMLYSLTANNIKKQWADMSAGCMEKHIASSHTAISHLMSMGPCAGWKRSHCCLIFHNGSRKILSIPSLPYQTWRFPSVARSLCNNSNSSHHHQPTYPSLTLITLSKFCKATF